MGINFFIKDSLYSVQRNRKPIIAWPSGSENSILKSLISFKKKITDFKIFILLVWRYSDRKMIHIYTYMYWVISVGILFILTKRNNKTNQKFHISKKNSVPLSQNDFIWCPYLGSVICVCIQECIPMSLFCGFYTPCVDIDIGFL